MILISKLYFRKSREEREWYVSGNVENMLLILLRFIQVCLLPFGKQNGNNLFHLLLSTKLKCIVIFGIAAQIGITFIISGGWACAI